MKLTTSPGGCLLVCVTLMRALLSMSWLWSVHRPTQGLTLIQTNSDPHWPALTHIGPLWLAMTYPDRYTDSHWPTPPHTGPQPLQRTSDCKSDVFVSECITELVWKHHSKHTTLVLLHRCVLLKGYHAVVHVFIFKSLECLYCVRRQSLTLRCCWSWPMLQWYSSVKTLATDF